MTTPTFLSPEQAREIAAAPTCQFSAFSRRDIMVREHAILAAEPKISAAALEWAAKQFEGGALGDVPWHSPNEFAKVLRQLAKEICDEPR